MGVRIFWQDIYPEIHPLYPDIHIVWDGLKRHARKVIEPDTEVTLSHVDKYCGNFLYNFLGQLNTVAMVNKIMQAEKEGYDAAIIGCATDPGLEIARSAVDIPVVGLGEASMLVAQMVGKRFAIVTVSDLSVPILERNLLIYQFDSRAIKNRPARVSEYWEPMIQCFQGRPETLISSFEKVALELIHDGADVIIAGCGYTAAALTLVGYNQVAQSGVPVIDISAVGLKMAELLAGLHKSVGLTKSKASTSYYLSAPQKMVEEARRAFKFVSD